MTWFQGIVFSMVIVRFSMDRTRWDSLKLTTHLNFVPDAKNDSSENEAEIELDSPVADYPSPLTPAHQDNKDRLTLASHIRSPSGMGLGLSTTGSLQSLGMFGGSKSSLHDSPV